MTLSTCLRGMAENSSFLYSRAVFVSYLPIVFGFWWYLQGIWQSIHFREECRFFLLFLRLWQFSWAIAHSFGVLSRFTRPMTLSTCLRGLIKNSFFVF
jgi:uncharacterized membrane protein YiaA